MRLDIVLSLSPATVPRRSTTVKIARGCGERVAGDRDNPATLRSRQVRDGYLPGLACAGESLSIIRTKP
jgi:hypothetical protein